jgi:multiple sugar transport system ATP-binding protein
MASIELENVTKRYGDGTEAVTEMTLEVADGEIVILVGPSGCGKSTALRMIAGLEGITDGELRIGRERVNDVAPADRDVAMVFQSYALYPHMTVRENMGFALKLAKMGNAEIDGKVEEAAATLGLGSELDRKPARLSGGQRQRVAMGRAIVRDPQAFLMDEPLSNLDAKLRVQMRTSVARLQRQLGTTTVYVTHDQTEAMTLGDRVAVMRDGVVQQVDAPESLYERPANVFVAGFIGSPAINLFPASVEGGAVRLPFGDARLPRPASRDGDRALGKAGRDRDVIVGIRPEHVEDAAFANVRGPDCLRFRARAEVVESMGAERYAYFTVKLGSKLEATAEQLVQQADMSDADSGAPSLAAGRQLIARLNGASTAVPGEEVELALDTSRIKLFETRTGRSLS